MGIVEQVCAIAREQSDGDRWDWMLLSLAYHANEPVKDLAEIAKRAHKIRHEVGGFKAELKSFSGPLKDLIREVKDLHDNEMASQRSRKRKTTHPNIIKSDKITPVIRQVLEAANDIQEPAVYLSHIKTPRNDDQSKNDRFRETVFDVLFQTYFKFLTEYLTTRNLEGGFDNMDKHRANWAMTRRFLRFRLEVIEKLGECGTAVFAARSYIELVFAPAKYLPLPREKPGIPYYNIHSTYVFLNLGVERGMMFKEAGLATPQGWNAITSSLKKNKDVIEKLAKKKDPSHSMLTHFRSPNPRSQS